MQSLTDHEKKILELVQRHPEIVSDKSEREKQAKNIGISEKTLRNRIADLKRYGLIESTKVAGAISKKDVIVIDQNGYKQISNSRPELITEEVALLDYIRIIVKRRKLILVNFFVLSFVVAIFSLIMPKTYLSSAVIMPPTLQTGLGFMSAFSSLPVGGFDFGVEAPESMTFLAILKSRTVMETVVEMEDLVKIYKADDMEEAIKNLRENVLSDIEEEGTIRVTAMAKTGWFSNKKEEDKSRKLATNIANIFVSELDRLNKKLKTEQASFQRIFIEERYNQNISDLQQAEEKLKEFQQDNNMIALPEQTKAAIEAAASIKTQILANEVKLGVLSSMLKPNHPDIIRIKVEIKELQSKLKDMEFTSTNMKNREDYLFPFFSEIPELGVQLVRLQREVEIQNGLFTFLTQQYEEAKIQEAKDTPTIQILDEAAIPIKRVKPRRAMMTYIAGIIGILFGVFLSFTLEYFEKIKRQSEDSKKVLEDISAQIKGDIFSIKNKFVRNSRR